MKQGEIWFVDLNPTAGSEQAGRRPVLILSGNMLNQYLPVVIVAPLTTKLKYYKGNPLLQPSSINGLKQPSEVLVFHIRSVSKDRFRERLGIADPRAVNEAIKTLNEILRY